MSLVVNDNRFREAVIGALSARLHGIQSPDEITPAAVKTVLEAPQDLKGVPTDVEARLVINRIVSDDDLLQELVGDVRERFIALNTHDEKRALRALHTSPRLNLEDPFIRLPLNGVHGVKLEVVVVDGVKLEKEKIQGVSLDEHADCLDITLDPSKFKSDPRLDFVGQFKTGDVEFSVRPQLYFDPLTVKTDSNGIATYKIPSHVKIEDKEVKLLNQRGYKAIKTGDEIKIEPPGREYRDHSDQVSSPCFIANVNGRDIQTHFVIEYCKPETPKPKAEIPKPPSSWLRWLLGR